jgi:hypothetical protein
MKQAIEFLRNFFYSSKSCVFGKKRKAMLPNTSHALTNNYIRKTGHVHKNKTVYSVP